MILTTEQRAAADLMARAGAYLDFQTFVGYMTPGHYASQPWHLGIISGYLNQVYSRKIKRLIINLPPGFAKSDFVTRHYPAFEIGRRPTTDLIITAYGDSIAKDFAGDIKGLIQSQRYRNVFNKIDIKSDQKAKNNWRIVNGGLPLGRAIASGIGGQITSRRAGLCIIDDPTKNIVEALSFKRTQAQFDWYRAVLRTRLHPGAAIILVMTRWSSHDLTARLLADTGPYGEKWTLCRIPALMDGESIWPERYSTKELTEIRASIGESFFNGLYMQAPTDNTSSVLGEFQIGDWPEDPDYCIAALDPKYAGKDTMGLTFLARKDGQHYVTGYCFYKDVRQEKETIIRLCRKHQAGTLWIETNADQGMSVDLFRPLYPMVKGFVSHRHLGSKHQRVMIDFANNMDKIIFDKNCQQDYMLQVVSYSEGKEPDDCIDSLASACRKTFKRRDQYRIGL